MQAVFNSYLHLHRDDLIRPFDLFIRKEDSKVCLFDNVELPCYNNSDEIAYSARNSVEGFIVLFEICKFELVLFVFGKDASWFEFFGERCELSREIFVGVDFWMRKVVHKQPMRQHLMPRCYIFLVSLSCTFTVPLISSFLLQTGSLILSLPFLILWCFWFSLGSKMMSISRLPVNPPKKELILSCIKSFLPSSLIIRQLSTLTHKLKLNTYFLFGKMAVHSGLQIRLTLYFQFADATDYNQLVRLTPISNMSGKLSLRVLLKLLIVIYLLGLSPVSCKKSRRGDNKPKTADKIANTIPDKAGGSIIDQVALGAALAGGTAALMAGGLSALGFTSSGIAASSVAAGIQAGIGKVAAGSLFAAVQSVAATGVISTVGTVAAIGVGVVGAVYLGHKLYQNQNSKPKS